MTKVLFLVGIIFMLTTSICVATEQIPTIGELLLLAEQLGIDNDITKSISYKSDYGKVLGVTIQGKKGYYPSHIAKDFCDVKHSELLKANNISEHEAWNLPSNYTLFIPLKMLKDEFINPLPSLLAAKQEIKRLKASLAEEIAKRLGLEKILSQLLRKSNNEHDLQKIEELESRVDTITERVEVIEGYKKYIRPTIIAIVVAIISFFILVELIFRSCKK